MLAVINIGTNSTKALYGRIQNHTWQELSRELKVTGLGEGLAAEGRLSPEAMERTVAAVAELVAEGHALGAKQVWITATMALRQAENREEFKRRLAKQGQRLQILSGRQEAALSFLGLSSSLALCGSGLAFDLGAGSLEIMIGEGKELKESLSLPLGAGTLTEKFLQGDPPRQEELQALSLHLNAALNSLSPRSRGWFVGVGGAVTALCQLAADRRKYSRDLHGQKLSLGQIEKFYRQLSRLSLSERTALSGFENSKRAKIAPAGAAVILALMETYQVQELVVSEAGILDGMMEQMLVSYEAK